jgi:Histidine kinase-, DNA gyrase B-, and HSP90-like ATPase
MKDDELRVIAEATRTTYFASAERAEPLALAREAAAIIDHPIIRTVLESFSGQVLILNRHRQILAASREFQEALAACGIHEVLGLRPGEALQCEHAGEGPGGCGTSVACRHCGAVVAILTAHCCGEPVSDECWISMRRQNKYESVELRAKVTPVTIDGHDVMVLALQDISDQKRRGVLEQSLLHDARNLLGGILTWSELMAMDAESEAATSLRSLALQMRDLFAEHTLLAQAEKGALAVTHETLDLDAIAHALHGTFSRHPSGEGKNLAIGFPVNATPPVSDKALVLRVLINMVVNALEASKTGDTVHVHYQLPERIPTFSVHNAGVIPSEVAPRIFQRSFSTKSSPGHGLGTYSMRLFAEQYLGGKVSFSSSPEQGTVFRLELPKLAMS